MAPDAPTRPLTTVVETTGVALAADPARAAVRFRAAGVGATGVRSEIRIGAHTMVVDEPPSVGGAGAAPNPVEIALAALLSCQVVTYRLWAAKLDIPLDGIAVDVEGDLDVRGLFGLDDAVRPGPGDIRVVVTLSGPASQGRYDELAAAVDEHCPVLDLFRNPTPVTTRTRAGQDGVHE